jgi:hypothetical protein
MIKKGGFNPLGIVDFQSIALKYAGASSPDDPAVVTYLQGYTGTADHPGFSRLYFDRVVTATESLALSDPDVRWMIGQTMFHHEAGQRAPVDRETFDRGVVLGSRIIQTAAPAVLTSEADRPGAPRSDTSIQIDVGRYSVRFGNGVDLNLLSRVLTVLDGRQ